MKKINKVNNSMALKSKSLLPLKS